MPGKKFSLSFWLEGAELLLLYCDAMLGILKSESGEKTTKTLNRFYAQREKAAHLFSLTYPDESVAEELDMRYGVYTALLEAYLAQRPSASKEKGKNV